MITHNQNPVCTSIIIPPNIILFILKLYVKKKITCPRGGVTLELTASGGFVEGRDIPFTLVTQSGITDYARDVAYGNGRFLAVRQEGMIAYSNVQE